jgi:signal peptidase I
MVLESFFSTRPDKPATARPGNARSSREHKRQKRRLWLIVCVCLIGAFCGWRREYRLAVTVGESMQPTLGTGNLLVIRKTAYDSTEPRRGDIVVAECRGDLLVKRIVGLPGDEVEVRGGLLYLNGVRCREGYAVAPGPLTIRKGRLGAGRFAILGDNRSVPLSLITHGIVGKKEIVGKVVWSIP